MITSLQSWTLPPRMLSPAGIYCISSEKKSVLIVYSQTIIATYLFQNLENSIQQNLPCTKYFAEELSQELKHFITTDLNTIGFDVTGQILYFKSFNTTKYICNVTNVKAMCKCSQGFVALRNSDPVTVVLEIYSDKIQCEELHRIKSFDLSWDKSDIQGLREIGSYHVYVLKIPEETEEFFKCLTTSDSASAGKEIIFFSIDNIVNCLVIAENDEHDIISIRICATHIRKIWYSYKYRILLILLESGTIEILSHYLTSENETKIKIETLFIGHEIWALESITSEIFFFSNGFQCFKVTVKKSQDEFLLNFEEFKIPGVVCLTYIEHLQTVLSITENNIFYAIHLHQENEDKLKAETDIYLELKTQALQNIENVTEYLSNTFQTSRTLREKIKNEYKYLEIMGVISNMDLFKGNCSAKVTYAPQLKNYTDNFPIIICNDKENINSLEFIIELSIKTELINILVNGLWSICITTESEGKFSKYHLELNPKVKYLLLWQNSDGSNLMPVFNVELIAVINFYHSSFYVSFPLKVKSDYSKNTIIVQNSSDISISSKINHNIRSILSTEANYVPSCKVKLPNNCSLQQQFQDQKSNILINFENEFVRIISKDDWFHLKTEKPSTLFYAKQFILECLFREGFLRVLPSISIEKISNWKFILANEENDFQKVYKDIREELLNLSL